jgi:hypothetical protein
MGCRLEFFRVIGSRGVSGDVISEPYALFLLTIIDICCGFRSYPEKHGATACRMLNRRLAIKVVEVRALSCCRWLASLFISFLSA